MAKVNFDDIKNTVVNAVGTAAVKTRDFAEKASVKVKVGARIAKLNVDISSKRNAIEKAYTEIGKIYYDLHKNEPESMYVRIFDDIRVAYEDIDILEQEIEDLKLRKDDDADIEVEFEEIDPDEEAPAVVNDDELAKAEETPSCGCSIDANKTEEAPSCGCSIDANKTEEAPSCGCSIDANKTEEAPSCGCSIDANKTEEAPSCGCSIDANKAEEAPSCGCSIDNKDSCGE